VFKSTKKYPDNSLMDRVTFLGGSINAYTEFDTTCFYITLPSKFTEEALSLMAEIVRQADFTDRDFESEKKVIIEEFKQYQDDPEDFFVEEIAKTYFKKNNYRKPIIGSLESLEKSTADQLRSFYQEYYSPSNCFMVASGDLEEEKFLKMLEPHFADWQKKKVEKLPIMKEDFPNIPEVICFDKKISSDMLAFVLPDLAETNPESYALSMAGKVFAVGNSSRLFHRLFNVEKLIDTIKVHSLSGLNDGINIFLVMPKKGADLNKISQVFLEELERLYNYGLSEIEIADNIKELTHFYRYSFEYVESLATALGNEEILSDYNNFFEYPKLVKSLNKKVVDKSIKRYFKKNSLFVYHIGKGKFDREEVLKNIHDEKKSSHKDYQNKEFFQTTLSNGMKILLKRVKGKPTVGVSLSYGVSQLNETSINLGTNLMTSSLLLYGNENRNYKQLMNFCSSNGISLGISPSLETTNVKLKCFNEMLPISLEIIAEITQKPLFPKEHFENMRNTFSSNLDRMKDFPQYYGAHLWAEMFFGKNS
ncbi:MAG: insulinase family protein, partial [Candidatus Cloacimonetes bacterium]|nr:insulinase family protein [Candidatus Cloacimonadota bacterium]